MTFTDKIKGLNNTDTKIVAATQAISGATVFWGSAHYLGDKLPGSLEKVRQLVAKHLVEPHLETLFEKRFGHLLHAEDIAHEKEHLVEGEKSYLELSRSEQVHKVSDIITKESFTFVLDSAVTLALQYAAKFGINKVKGPCASNIKPGKVVFSGCAVQLGSLGLMSVLSKPTNKLYQGLTASLAKNTPMSAKTAKEYARHVTYVGVPGFLGFVAELAVADAEHQKPKGGGRGC